MEIIDRFGLIIIIFFFTVVTERCVKNTGCKCASVLSGVGRNDRGERIDTINYCKAERGAFYTGDDYRRNPRISDRGGINHVCPRTPTPGTGGGCGAAQEVYDKFYGNNPSRPHSDRSYAPDLYLPTTLHNAIVSHR